MSRQCRTCGSRWVAPRIAELEAEVAKLKAQLEANVEGRVSDLLEDALALSMEENERLRGDIAEAAGEYMVDIPEPGTPLSVLLSANTMMRRDRDEAKAENERLLRRINELELEKDNPWTPTPEDK